VPSSKRSTINDQIKTIQQIAHTRRRSMVNAIVNALAALVAYSHQPRKPRKPPLNISKNEINLLACKE